MQIGERRWRKEGGGFKLSKEETDVSARTRMCVREREKKEGRERAGARSFASDDNSLRGTLRSNSARFPSEGFPVASTVAFRSVELSRGMDA